MLKYLKIIDLYYSKIIRLLISLLMIFLTIMINVLVVCRYILHINLGGFEEMPVFIMIISVWLGAGIVARKDEHVKIDFLQTKLKNDNIKKIIQIFINTLTTIVMWYYTYLSYKFVVKSIAKGDISSGIGFPLWWAHAFVFIGSFTMSIYYASNTIKQIRSSMK